MSCIRHDELCSLFYGPVYRHLISSAAGDRVEAGREELLYSRAIQSNVLIYHCGLFWRCVWDRLDVLDGFFSGYHVYKTKMVEHSNHLSRGYTLFAILQSGLRSTVITVSRFHCSRSRNDVGPLSLKSFITRLFSAKGTVIQKPAKAGIFWNPCSWWTFRMYKQNKKTKNLNLFTTIYIHFFL